MSQELTLSSVKDILRFPFRDHNWQNRFLIGSALVLAATLLYFIPLVSLIPYLFVMGYAYRVQRRAARSGELVLPAWDDWGGLALDGLKGMLISLAYTLPGLVVLFGGIILYYVLSFVVMIPMGFMEDSGGAVLAMLALIFISMAVMFLGMFVGWALMLLGMVPLPMATAHFVARDELGAAFRLSKIWSLIKADKLGYFVAYVVVAGLGMMLYMAFALLYTSMVLCALIPFLVAPAMFYIWLVNAAVFGLTYRESAALAKANGLETETEAA
jgi:hypothetical protein